METKIDNFTFVNTITGEVAQCNDDWLWVSQNPDSMPPEDIICKLVCGEMNDYRGWRLAHIEDVENQTEEFLLSEKELDKFLLNTDKRYNAGKQIPLNIRIESIVAKFNLQLEN